MRTRALYLLTLVFFAAAGAAEPEADDGGSDVTSPASSAHLRRRPRYTVTSGNQRRYYQHYGFSSPDSLLARSFTVNRQTIRPEARYNFPHNTVSRTSHQSYRRGKGKQRYQKFVKQSIVSAVRRYEKNGNKTELAKRIEKILSHVSHNVAQSKVNAVRMQQSKEQQKVLAQFRRVWSGILESKEGLRSLRGTCGAMNNNITILRNTFQRQKQQYDINLLNVQQKMEQIENHQDIQDRRYFEVVGMAMNNTRRASRMQGELEQDLRTIRMEKKSMAMSLNQIQSRLHTIFREDLNQQNTILSQIQSTMFSHGDMLLQHDRAASQQQSNVAALNATYLQQQRDIERITDIIEKLGLGGKAKGSSSGEPPEARSRLSSIADLQSLVARLNRSLQHAAITERRFETRMALLERNIEKIATYLNTRSRPRPQDADDVTDVTKGSGGSVNQSTSEQAENAITPSLDLDGFKPITITRLAPTSQDILAAIAETGFQDRLDRMSRSLHLHGRKLNNVTGVVASLTEDVRAMSMTTANYFEIINQQARDIRSQNETINQLLNKFDRQESIYHAHFDYQHQMTQKLMEAVIGFSKQISLQRPLEQNRDCHDIWMTGQTHSGVYTIIKDMQLKPVYCNMTAMGGWTIIQRRNDGTQEFNKGVNDYENGFGSIFGEYWLGLDTIRWLTHGRIYTLRILLEDWAGNQRYANYDRFMVYGQHYVLMVSGYSGDAGDSLTASHEVPFKARRQSRENTITRNSDCTSRRQAGWWFPRNCGEANPNGPYPGDPRDGANSKEAEAPHKYSYMMPDLEWMRWRNNQFPLRKVSLQIIPREALIETPFSTIGDANGDDGADDTDTQQGGDSDAGDGADTGDDSQVRGTRTSHVRGTAQSTTANSNNKNNRNSNNNNYNRRKSSNANRKGGAAANKAMRRIYKRNSR